MSQQNYDPSSPPLDVVLKQLACGGIAGCVAKTSIAPLERVKILFQVNSPHYPYTGVWSTLSRIFQRERLSGLYKGNISSIVRVFPYAAIQFSSFDFFKSVLTPKHEKISLVANFCAGALAGSTATLFTYPLDVTRARLAVQVSQVQYDGMIHALKTMWKNEGGLSALYRGMGPTLTGIVPYAGINFFVFDTLKYAYRKNVAPDPNEPIPTYVRLVCGAIAGLSGQTATYPLDVVRRRMQIDGLKLEQAYEYKYKGTWDALRTIYQKEGFQMLYRGLHINYIKVIPIVSLSFTINDLLRKWVGIYRDSSLSSH